MKGSGILFFVLAGLACRAPGSPRSVTVDSVQNGETAYTSLRPIADSGHPLPPPTTAPAVVTGEDLSGFMIASTGPIELVLIDRSGRRTGQAGEGAPDLREIPRSGTDCDYISSDSDSGGGDTPHVLELMASQPDSGRYVLEAYATGDGTFNIDFDLTSAAGNTTSIQGVGGEVKKGMVRRYAFTFPKFDPTPARIDTLGPAEPR